MKVEGIMEPDLWSLYRQMLRSRSFEVAVSHLWNEGKITGEMHLGIGEEAIVAGVNAHLREGDALALDHRGTPPLVMRGVDLVLLLREFVGRADGLCRGMGGHMHLFSPENLAASSGIVGASGPAAVGFALAGQHLRPGSMSVAFFGEGATNEGMMMESMNLAVVWNLPILFVCKDNDWAITTLSSSITGGKLVQRAQSFGMPAIELDGVDVLAVWQAVAEASNWARDGRGPTFLHAHCSHPEGHFLGDPVLRMVRHVTGATMRENAWAQLKAVVKPRGTSLVKRVASMKTIGHLLGGARAQTSPQLDPLERIRPQLSDNNRLASLEASVTQEVQQAVDAALAPG
jgi:TPP-dependent pyruvate/acetoin dehydrogenase alpha subunit